MAQNNSPTLVVSYFCVVSSEKSYPFLFFSLFFFCLIEHCIEGFTYSIVIFDVVIEVKDM
jgi:hypothetical protein